MFTGSQVFTTFQRRSRSLSGGWWFIMLPGLFLTVMAVAILLWPELLAYMVAGVLLFAGISLLLWSWSLRQMERRAGNYVRYEVY